MSLSLHKILNNSNRESSPVLLHGLGGSSKALVVSMLSKIAYSILGEKKPVVVVCESFDIAEVFLKDIYYYYGREGVYFFPFWDVLPYDNFSPHKGLTAQRFRTLDALLSNQARILVTTPNALMQCFMPRNIFLKTTFTLKNGFIGSPVEICKMLVNSGYIEVDVVEEIGEFSTHGGILDVFPLNLEKPIRIKFSEKSKVQSLKTFEIQSQQTDQTELSSLKILPASEIIFNQKNTGYARQSLKEYTKDLNSDVLLRLRESLEKKEGFPGIESLSPLFYPERETLFDYFQDEYFLIINENKNVYNRADSFYQEVFLEYEISTQQNKLTFSPESLFLSHRELNTKLAANVNLVLTSMKIENTKSTIFHQFQFLDNKSLRNQFESAKVTSAAGYMVQLIQKWQNSRTPVLLSAKSQTHANRFQQLLQDLGVESTVAGNQMTTNRCPWFEWLEKGYTENTSGPIPILIGKVSNGFRKIDLNGKVLFVLLTEEEVFGEKTKKRSLQRTRVHQTSGSLDDLKEGDHVVHLDYGIGHYNGLQKISAGGNQKEFMKLVFGCDEKVYVPIENIHLVQKYVNAGGTTPQLSKLGEKAWKKTRSKVAKTVENIAEELADIYAERKARKGFAFAADGKEMQKFELRFKFEETPDQLDVISSVKADMEKEMPMDRLVCGDVGFGKTEIAMRAAFKAVQQEKQVAFLVPTTILAQQHYETFCRRFEETPFIIDVISRFRTTKEQKGITKRLQEGKIDVLIGTHRMLSTDISFKELGLLVVDEEQRFGVKHKEKIKRFRASVDVLTLSATPIPRTLHMSLMGIRDLSLVNTPPADRRAVRTRLLPANDYIIQEAVSREIRRGGQVYIVHNRIDTIYKYERYLTSILPNVKIVTGHGQMKEEKLEKVMMEFIDGEFDVLLSTTIIESGLDITNANTIIINNAHIFGLSQLYQLRGRVGRSNVQAYAYLLVPQDLILSGVANERLNVLKDLNDLGAGFKVASRDLEIRGAGNLLGSEQSGQIASVGLELYTQMVNKAVKKLRQSESGLSVEDIQVKLSQIDQIIPESYISSTNQRLSLYKAVAILPTKEELWELRNGIENRFGMLPESVLNIFRNAEIRLWGQLYGVEKIEHDRNRLRLQIKDSSKIDHNKLVEWLCDDNISIKYIPENILDLNDVPADMHTILNKLKQLEQVFIIKK
ncbi:MAG: transcription-repair coupling factor [Deltaproteobacteria bacterium]|nr:transcription-repair coupling factor [Deltaproteobacteria bacterium]